MNQIIKNILKSIKTKIYRADNKQDLSHLSYAISLLQSASHLTHNKDELNQLLKLRKQLNNQCEIVSALNDN